ncbi:hypothetical protein [Motilibacter aurantiacus]|uniref:hypothetical protein n=1 Tax=Motilibacter aurantiacus TaxID=2714955 RepID=UPI00140E1E1B|nr:hypothetical protein [Motilibacter aurantiacus]NHC44235.1 hypothetical protein [Motilibacter aurantiacus]
MNADALVRVAAVSYAANCALGTAAASGVDTRRVRWLHHALFVTTATLTATAAGAGLLQRRPAAYALLPAAVPLALIPHLGTHGPRHRVVALSAAPFYVAALGLSRR